MGAQKDANDLVMVTPLVHASNYTSAPSDPGEVEFADAPERLMLVVDAQNTGGDGDESATIKLLGRDDDVDGSQENVQEAHQGADIAVTVNQGDGQVVQRVELADMFRFYEADVSFSGSTPAFDLGVYLIGTDPARTPVTQQDN